MAQMCRLESGAWEACKLMLRLLFKHKDVDTQLYNIVRLFHRTLLEMRPSSLQLMMFVLCSNASRRVDPECPVIFTGGSAGA